MLAVKPRRPSARRDSQIRVGPSADDAGRPRRLILTGEHMVGAFQRYEAAGVPRGAEDLARIGDANSVVGRRMHDEQRPSQGADPFAEIGGPDVLDEMSLE